MEAGMDPDKQRPAVVAVIGSPHRKGNTVAIVESALDELEAAGCDCTRIVLADRRIDACDGHVDCGERVCPHDDDMAEVLERVYSADAVIFATPVYFENVSGQMKVFIDRTATRYYHEQWLAPKVVGLIAVAAESDPGDTLAALQRFVALSNPDEMPVLTLGALADKPTDAAKDENLMTEARALGGAIARKLGLDES